MRLTAKELLAVLDACAETEAGDYDGWTDDGRVQLEFALDKLRADLRKRNANRKSAGLPEIAFKPDEPEPIKCMT